MSDTTAKIRAKGLDATGVTEDIAEEMFHAKGRHYMGIVELRVDATHETAEGKRGVDLILTQVEPAVDDDLAEHLRELTRTIHLNRGQRDGQMAIDATLGDERTVADVMSAGKHHRPHPFLPDDAAKDTPLCDVCGQIDAAALHSTQDAFPDDEDDVNDPEDENENIEPAPASQAFTSQDPFIPIGS